MKSSLNFPKKTFTTNIGIQYSEYELFNEEPKLNGYNIKINTENFNNNLNISINDVQKLADYIDDMVLGGISQDVLDEIDYTEILTLSML